MTPTVIVRPVGAKSNGTAPALPVPHETPEAEIRPVTRRAVHDPLSSRRQPDPRHEGRITYSVSTVDQNPVRESGMEGVLRNVGETFPSRAEEMAHFYDRRLLNALDNYHLLAEETERAVRERKPDTAALRAELSSMQGLIRARMAAEVARHRESLDDADRRLAAAHRRASRRVAETGGLYDPNAPSASCVLRHERDTDTVVAGKRGLPHAKDRWKLRMPAPVMWALSIGVGSVVGASLGITVHSLDADFLNNLASEWKTVLVWCAVGFSITTASKFGLQYAWGLASEERYLEGKLWRQSALLANAAFWFVALLAGDIALERTGLLAMQAVQSGMDSLGKGGSPSQSSSAEAVAFWLIPGLITAGYLLCAASEGFVTGRDKAVSNRIEALREESFQQQDVEARSDRGVRRALAAIARVLYLLHWKEGIEAKIRRDEERATSEIAALDERLARASDEPTEEEQKRLQALLNQLRGTQIEYDYKLTQLLDACEPMGGRLKRAWCGWKGVRPNRRERVAAGTE